MSSTVRRMVRAHRSSAARRYPSPAMRLSHLFFTTLRDDPADAEMPSHRLLLRAGYVRQLGSGIYSLLPLGKRVNDRVEQVIREEQDRIGGQEMEMPVVHPADIWRASGRYDAIGPELGRFKDRNGRDMVLAMTHEEVVGILLADIVKSYRQLPMHGLPLPDEVARRAARPGRADPRPRVRHEGRLQLRPRRGRPRRQLRAQHGAYVRTFERLGLETVAVSSDVGIMGGSQAHEFMVLNPAGEDVLVLCEACGYAANRQVAVIPKPDPPPRSPLPLEEVATPGTTTIATLAAFLGIGPERTAKAAFFVTGDGRLVTAIVRGDHEVNETKLGNAVERDRRHPARPRSRRSRPPGMEPGYGSPIGAHDTVVVVDDLVARSPNLVAGANREGFHYRNVNVGRDFTPDVTADITNAQEGDPCPTCGQPVILRNGIEVGNIFKLGTKFTRRRRGDLPRRGRRRAPDRHGLVRHRRRAQRRLHRRGPPRRQGHHLAGRGRARTRPISCRSAPPRSRASPRSPSASMRSPPRPVRATRSCGTTATSRRA